MSIGFLEALKIFSGRSTWLNPKLLKYAISSDWDNLFSLA